MKFSNELDQIFSALAIAQGQIKPALKDSANPFFKSKYADLASCWEVCREPLSKNGLSIIQNAKTENGDVLINTILAHKSGQYIANQLKLKPAKLDPQSIGSAITYGRRYELMAMVGIAPEDDDGNQSSAKTTQKENLTPNHAKWTGAKDAVKNGTATIEQIKLKYNLTPENEVLLND